MLKIDFKPPLNQLCQFGYIALAGFPLVGAVLTQVAGLPTVVGTVGLALGAVMGLAAAYEATPVLRPVYVLMMLIAWPIGLVVATVMLSLIYFGMFTPVALWFRIKGRDALKRKLDPDAESYWHVRDDVRTPASYLRLY